MKLIDQIDGEVLQDLPFALENPETLFFYDGAIITFFAKPKPLIKIWLDTCKDSLLWLIFEVNEDFGENYKTLSATQNEYCLLWNSLQRSEVVYILEEGKENHIKRAKRAEIDPELLLVKPKEEHYQIIGFGIEYAASYACKLEKTCRIEGDTNPNPVQNSLLVKITNGIVVGATTAN